uniref:RadC family protein n=1 Tax=Hylemonella sp. TaxID=2066020 RepID=UPI0035ADB822
MAAVSMAHEGAGCYGLSDGVLSYRHELAAHECSVIDAALSILGRYLRQPGKALDQPAAVKEYLQLAIGSESREVFGVLYLDNQHQLIAFENHFLGTLSQTGVYPREVLRAALRHNAAAVILSHNHPSGNTSPSNADMVLTEAIRTALVHVDVRLLDHVIVAPGKALSMAECGLLWGVPVATPAQPMKRKRGRPRKSVDPTDKV